MHNSFRQPTDLELLILTVPLDISEKNRIFRFKKIFNIFSNTILLQDILVKNYLAPFFYNNLKKTKTSYYLPSPFLERLAYISSDAELDNFIRYNSIKEIAEYFCKKDINFILLKGMALFLTVYRKNPIRLMSDIDILIDEADVENVKTALHELDYKISNNGGHQSRWHSLMLSPILKELVFEKHFFSKTIQIDVHWGIIKGIETSFMNHERLKKDIICLNIENNKFFMLSAENLIIHLCTNLYKNMVLKKNYIISFCDIIETMKYYKDKIDFDILVKSIKEENLSNIVFPIFLLLYKLNFVNLPDRIIHQFETNNQNVFIKEENFLIKNGQEGRYYSGLISGINGLANKVFFVFSLIFPKPKELLVYYPKSNNKTIILYYLKHWYKVVIKISHILEYNLKI